MCWQLYPPQTPPLSFSWSNQPPTEYVNLGLVWVQSLTAWLSYSRVFISSTLSTKQQVVTDTADSASHDFFGSAKQLRQIASAQIKRGEMLFYLPVQRWKVVITVPTLRRMCISPIVHKKSSYEDEFKGKHSKYSLSSQLGDANGKPPVLWCSARAPTGGAHDSHVIVIRARGSRAFLCNVNIGPFPCYDLSAGLSDWDCLKRLNDPSRREKRFRQRYLEGTNKHHNGRMGKKKEFKLHNQIITIEICCTDQIKAIGK